MVRIKEEIFTYQGCSERIDFIADTLGKPKKLFNKTHEWVAETFVFGSTGLILKDIQRTYFSFEANTNITQISNKFVDNNF